MIFDEQLLLGLLQICLYVIGFGVIIVVPVELLIYGAFKAFRLIKL